MLVAESCTGPGTVESTSPKKTPCLDRASQIAWSDQSPQPAISPERFLVLSLLLVSLPLSFGSWLMPAHHGLVCRLAKSQGYVFISAERCSDLETNPTTSMSRPLVFVQVDAQHGCGWC